MAIFLLRVGSVRKWNTYSLFDDKELTSFTNTAVKLLH